MTCPIPSPDLITKNMSSINNTDVPVAVTDVPDLRMSNNTGFNNTNFVVSIPVFYGCVGCESPTISVNLQLYAIENNIYYPISEISTTQFKSSSSTQVQTLYLAGSLVNINFTTIVVRWSSNKVEGIPLYYIPDLGSLGKMTVYC